MEIISDDNGKFCSLAFKLWTDPYVGKLVFFRVYSGQLSKGDVIYNPRTRKRERVSRVMMIQADKRIDVETTFSGDIAALVGLKNITTGDTLCDEDQEVLLEPPTFPEPVISMAVEPKTKADREKMGEGLQRLAEEDPTFRCFTNEETGQLIIAGMGELHLEIIRDRLFREFKVSANAGAPQIAYRETVTKAAEGEGKFIRQSGGRGQYGHACITLAPNERGKGVEIENKIVGGTIPKEYIPAVEDGIEEAIAGGVLAGYPVVDVKVAIVDGTFHEVDSSELAFKMAGIFAFKEAAKKASPYPARADHEGGSHHAGRVPGRSAGRPEPAPRQDCPHRGQGRHDHRDCARCRWPRCSATPRRFARLSKGRAAYSMEPFRFEPVPASITTSILDSAKGKPAARA